MSASSPNGRGKELKTLTSAGSNPASRTINSTTIQARDYQIQAVQSLYDYFYNHAGNPIIALPTGTGKSVVIALFLQRALQQWPQTKVLVLTHVKELIEQNTRNLQLAWPEAPCGIYSAGLNRRESNNQIVFGGIASIYKKPELFGKIDLLIIDECHLVSPTGSTMYSSFIEKIKQNNPWLKVIGFSATAFRRGQGRLTEGEDSIFTDICFDMTNRRGWQYFIQNGYLSIPVPRPTRTMIDVSSVGITNGDYKRLELQAVANRQMLNNQIADEMLMLAEGRKSILVFCSGIEHAEDFAAMLRFKGQTCETVHSKIDATKRAERIEGFKSGRIRCLTNNNVLTTGFDYPALDCIGMLRPTISAGLWVQMVGRGTRPASGKTNCLVLDFAGNTARLGPVDDPAIPRPRTGGPGEIPVKICDNCGVYNHIRVRFCDNCGFEFIFDEKLERVASTSDLISSVDLPRYEDFEVDYINYEYHISYKSGTPILKVTYYTKDKKSFTEMICLEHDGFAGKKARDWWRERSELPSPDTVQEAYDIACNKKLLEPEWIRVWVNKKPYKEIVKHGWSKTNYGE